ncbi:9792_t:CDS:2, partial [Entrophospora sp. SA101]
AQSKKWKHCQNFERSKSKIKNIGNLSVSVSTYRTGTSEVSEYTSTKLHQQMYGVFVNHVVLQKDILYSMVITINLEKLIENEKLVGEIIRQAVNLFKIEDARACFSSKNKASINTFMIYAAWDENELGDLYVEI